MFRNDSKEEKALKTVLLLALINLIVNPLYSQEENALDQIFSITLNMLVLFKFHEIGKSRRVGSNVLSEVNRFFSSQIEADSEAIDNTFKNIINGGAAVADKLAEKETDLINRMKG